MLIDAIATAVPPHQLDAERYELLMRQHYADAPHLASLLRAHRKMQVATRHFALPPEQLVQPRSFAARNEEYGRSAVVLAERAARLALDAAGVAADRLDMVATTSSTGLLTPSLEALLAPRLGLRPDVVRLPIASLGCAAAAAALSRVRDHLLARPGRIGLVLSVELPSLTFQAGDRSLGNLMTSALFGDGAAAVVMGAPASGPRFSLIDARSYLFPDTLGLMSLHAGGDGLHFTVDRDLPAFLRHRIRPLAEALLSPHRMTLSDLAFAAVHPGGARILADLESDFGLPPEATAECWSVLRHYGNLSSAAVLFILHQLALRRPPLADGSVGLLVAMGPGLAVELALLRWAA